MTNRETLISDERLIEAAIGRYEALKRQGRKGQHPLKVVWVNPFAISRSCKFHVHTKQERGSKWHDWGRVVDGDWDDIVGTSPNTHLDRTVIHRSVHARYISGIPWGQLDVMDAKMKTIQEKGQVDGCFNRNDLIARYQRLDETFERIATEGYSITKHQDNPAVPVLEAATSISIGRCGQLLLGSGGAHRLAIAKALNLSSIPVFVAMRHELWQRHIDLAGIGTTSFALSNHPDMPH